MPPTYTAGELAKHFGVAHWQIVNTIKRGFLPEPPRVGLYRVWVESDLDQVRDALVRAGYLPEAEVAHG
jgi:hypothetical protein